MAYTLYDALADLARTLGDYQDSAVTGWTSPNRLLDTALTQPADYWTNGTVLVNAFTTTGPPVVDVPDTAYVAADYAIGDITLSPNPSWALRAGLPYLVVSPKFPLWRMKGAINQALRAMGRIHLVTTFTATAGQQEYDESDSAAIAEKIMRLEVANASADPYDWTVHQRWEQQPMGTLALGNKLIFTEGSEPPNAYLIKLHYLALHPELSLVLDEIADSVHPEVLRWSAAVECWRWRRELTMNDEPMSEERLAEALQHRALAEVRYPIAQRVDTKMGRW